MTATGKKERLHHLDGIRGIAALGVVIGHSNWPNHIEWLGFRTPSLWVDFFFVLSGFVIAYNYQARLGEGFGVGNYMARRLARIYPAHFVMLLLMLGYELLKLAYQSGGTSTVEPAFGDNTVERLLASFALIQAMGLDEGSFWNSPSWSISTEVWTYLLFGVIFLWLRRSRGWIVACTMAVIALSYGAILLNPEREYLSVESDFGFFRCLIGFGLGVLCFNAWLTRQARSAGSAMQGLQWLLMAAAFAAVASPLYLSPWTLAAPLLFGALVYLLAVYRRGSLERCLLIRPIQFLGTISYSLYISHFLINRFVATAHRMIAPKLSGVMTPEQFGDILILADIPTTIGFGWLVWRFVETPANAWLVARMGRKGPDPEKGPAEPAF